MIRRPRETKGAAITAPRIYWPGLAVDAQGLRRSAAMPSPTMNKARRSCIHAESVGICCETTAGTPGPPWSTIVPWTVRSASPSAPSVTVAVMVPVPVGLAPLKVCEAKLEVEAVALLLAGLGSVVAELALAVLEIVAPPLPGPACTTSVKAAEPAAASEARLQLTVPPAPAAGVVQVNVGPDVCANDTNVVPAGSASLNAVACAALGPLFVRPML